MNDKEFYAIFANEAYNYALRPGDPVVTQLPNGSRLDTGFQVVTVLDSPVSGYHGFAAFNQLSCTLVVNSAGSDDIMDFANDLVAMPLGDNLQGPDVNHLTKQAMGQLVNHTGCTVNLVSTGHSAGGADAEYNVQVIGGTGYVYNGDSNGGVIGSLLGLIGVHGVANVHYIESGTPGIINWLVTSFGQKSATGGITGLLGGTLQAPDVTFVPGAIGHGMQQLLDALLGNPHKEPDPAPLEFHRAVSAVASANADSPEAGFVAAMSRGDRVAASNSLIQIPYFYSDAIVRTVAGAEGGLSRATLFDLTSQQARQIGVDAYVAEQHRIADERAAAQRSTGGGTDSHHDPAPTNVGGGAADSGRTSGVTGNGFTGGTTGATPGGMVTITGGPYGGPGPVANQTKTTVFKDGPLMGYDGPILLDLNGNGIEIGQLDRSTTFVDSNGDGLQHRTAWAGSGDGVLFFDAGNDGKISEKREYVFTEWDPTAKDDMAALRSRFDSNGDGKLTSADAAWSNFKVMVTNADGTQTAKTLTELGITEINLRPDATHVGFDDGSEITGQTTFTMGGVTHVVAAVTLVAEADGHQVTQTTAGSLDLHRFRSGLLRAMFAMKETGYGTKTQRRV